MRNVNSHYPQAVAIKKMINGTLQVVGLVSWNIRIFNLFNIHVRLLLYMCKSLDGKNLTSYWSVIYFANFCGAKVSLYMVL